MRVRAGVGAGAGDGAGDGAGASGERDGAAGSRSDAIVAVVAIRAGEACSVVRLRGPTRDFLCAAYAHRSRCWCVVQSVHVVLVEIFR